MQQRRQPGAASPALRSSAAGRLGELARSLGKPQGVLEVKDGRQVGAGSWLRADGHRKGCWFACFRSQIRLAQQLRTRDIYITAILNVRHSFMLALASHGMSLAAAHTRVVCAGGFLSVWPSLLWRLV